MVRNRDSAFSKDKTFNVINPIQHAQRDGVFLMSTNTIEKYKANLYTLIFTSEGERVMEPTFGTIINRLLFEPLGEDTHQKIKRDIIEKTATWIPQITIMAIDFGDVENDIENNKVTIKIDFKLTLDSTIQDFIEIEMGI